MTELNLNNTIQTFKSPLFEGHEIRVFGTPDEPLFVASDICTILGLQNVSEAISSLDEDEKGNIICSDVTGRQRETKVVNESGLYNLVFKSKKEKAKLFKKWVTSDILPSIRKTGSYKLQQENQYLQNTIRCLEEDKLKKEEEIILTKAKEFDRYVTINQYEKKYILYVGYTGIRNNKLLFKYGRTEDVIGRMKKHKRDFPMFELLFINETSSGVFAESYLKREMTRLGNKTSHGSCTELFEISTATELEPILESLETHIETTNEFISKHEHLIMLKDREMKLLEGENSLLKCTILVLQEKIRLGGNCRRCSEQIPKCNESSLYCDDCWEKNMLDKNES